MAREIELFSCLYISCFLFNISSELMRIEVFLFQLSIVATHGWIEMDNDDLSGSAVSVEVMSHSFGSPFRYDPSFLNWYISGSTVQTRMYRLGLIMNPGISDRHGFLWNKELLKTNEFDFNMMLSFDDFGNQKTASEVYARDQRLGIFFSSQNVSALIEKAAKSAASADWSSPLRSQGIDVDLGVPLFQRRSFKGIGVVISPVDETSGILSPTVTLICGDSRRAGSLTENKAEMSSTKLSFLRLKIRVRSDSVSVMYQDYADWRTVVELNSLKGVPTNGFIGISSYTGSSGPNKKPFRARISSLHLKSHILEAVAESDDIFSRNGLSISQLIDGSTYADSVAQTNVMRKLSNILLAYMESTTPVYNQFRQQISTLQKNITEMDAFVSSLTQEAKFAFQQTKKPSDGRKGVEALASQVKSIHSALDEIEKDRTDILRQVEYAHEEEEYSRYGVDRHLGYYGERISVRGEEIDQLIQQENRFTLILFLIVVMTAFGMGLAFYYRLRKYAEKAHAF